MKTPIVIALIAGAGLGASLVLAMRPSAPDAIRTAQSPDFSREIAKAKALEVIKQNWKGDDEPSVDWREVLESDRAHYLAADVGPAGQPWLFRFKDGALVSWVDPAGAKHDSP